MIRELDEIVLADDLPEFGLEAGDLGTVVLIHEGGKGYEIEFMALDGETVTVTTLSSAQVREVRGNEIAHARGLIREA